MTTPWLPRRSPPFVACVLAVAACGPALPDPGTDAEKLRQAGLDQLAAAGKGCTAMRKATEPDLFGWDSGSRGKVKATAAQGLVVVHFEQRGCDIAIAVLNCTTTKTSYRYTPRHAQQTRFAENDVDLYAHFPVAVADLRGRLGANRAIRADYRVEGIDMIPIGTSIGPGDLRGSECREATHVVSAIHRGAFAVAAGALTELRAGGNLFDASVHHKLGVFDGDGFQEACDGARDRGQRAAGCDEPLRIELQAIDPSTYEGPIESTAIPPPAPPDPAPAPEKTAREAPRPPPPRAEARTPPPRAEVRTPPPRAEVRTPPPRAEVRPAPPRAEVRAPAPPTPLTKVPFASFKASLAAGSTCPWGMAEIPGGVFTMGSDDEEDVAPRHRVKVAPFCLDVTEVTVAAYARCSACRTPGEGELCNAPGHGKDDHPQNCVSWDDAVTYCASGGKKLPTEAQWELAARGGSEQRRWPWGSAYPSAERACYNRWSPEDRGTCAAGGFPSTAFGLRDMAGNVWEWVADWYGPFAPGDPTPTPAKGAGRVIRGGGWNSSSTANLRTASRAATWPTNRDDYLGFRCAWTR